MRPRALTKKDAQPPLACVVLLVDEQVLGKTLDTLGKEGDLERGRAGVVWTGLEHLDGLVVQVGAGHLVRRNNLEALSARGHRRAHTLRETGVPRAATLNPAMRGDKTRGDRGSATGSAGGVWGNNVERRRTPGAQGVGFRLSAGRCTASRAQRSTDGGTTVIRC